MVLCEAAFSDSCHARSTILGCARSIADIQGTSMVRIEVRLSSIPWPYSGASSSQHQVNKSPMKLPQDFDDVGKIWSPYHQLHVNFEQGMEICSEGVVYVWSSTVAGVLAKISN